MYAFLPFIVVFLAAAIILYLSHKKRKHSFLEPLNVSDLGPVGYDASLDRAEILTLCYRLRHIRILLWKDLSELYNCSPQYSLNQLTLLATNHWRNGEEHAVTLLIPEGILTLNVNGDGENSCEALFAGEIFNLFYQMVFGPGSIYATPEDEEKYHRAVKLVAYWGLDLGAV